MEYLTPPPARRLDLERNPLPAREVAPPPLHTNGHGPAAPPAETHSSIHHAAPVMDGPRKTWGLVRDRHVP